MQWECARRSRLHRGHLAGRRLRRRRDGPDGVPVELTNLGFADTWRAAEARGIEDAVANVYDLDVASFHVCYTGSEFSIVEADAWRDVLPQFDCDDVGEPVDAPPDLVAAAAACPDVFEDAHVCLTAGENETLLVGLESGTTCQYAAAGFPRMTASLAWLGNDVFGCTTDNALQHVSLTEGTVSETLVTCAAVTGFDGALFLKPPFGGTPEMADGSMYAAHGLLHAQCGVFDEYEVTTRNTRITAHGLTLYSSWHATDRVEGVGIEGRRPRGDRAPGLRRLDPGDLRHRRGAAGRARRVGRQPAPHLRSRGQLPERDRARRGQRRCRPGLRLDRPSPELTPPPAPPQRGLRMRTKWQGCFCRPCSSGKGSVPSST